MANLETSISMSLIHFVCIRIVLVNYSRPQACGATSWVGTTSIQCMQVDLLLASDIYTP